MPNAAAASSGANKLGRLVYNTFVKRNSVFVATIFVSAFAFEIAFDEGTSKLLRASPFFCGGNCAGSGSGRF
ncbi:hypothetical protein BC938DRAFT_475378 [Jimgerdemannia flammicorona]|uniref:Complex III subunit 9 n=1 Tax=Jimgerdemannia flammicorona TaxID=994334 RepID=A0A433QRK9_9FUNG|nr:hypothetical protein BC938DRAFT_475378 [Jimgerdemannia flammicorona]